MMVMMQGQLTGRTRFRAAKGQLIFQVQVRTNKNIARKKFPPMWILTEFWRDARVEDLCELQTMTYGRVDVTVKLPDVPQEVIGETPPLKTRKH